MSIPRRFRPLFIIAIAVSLSACGSKKSKDKKNSSATASDKTNKPGLVDPDDRQATGKNGRLASMAVLRKSLARVSKSYADLQRIDPREMLYQSLHLVQFRIPEVLVEADKKRGEVTVMVNEKSRTFVVSDVDTPRAMTAKLREVFRFIETNMNPGADVAQVEYAAVNGMLSTLDPHSVLLNPDTAREMDVHTRGKFGGLGIIIRMYKQRLTVVRPLAGTPAYRAGIKTGDHIYKINDEITENLTLTESVSRMRGDPRTKITLWIKRKGAPTKSYRIERAIIRVESVESRKLGANVGYIKLKQFSGRTGTEVKAAMKTLKADGVDRFILDLRWNPGGLLEKSIEVADLFLNQGDIVTTIGGGQREQRNAKRGGDVTSPVVVLVNGGSASASEIVAGALRYQNRALLIGTQTFGKGSVQVLYDNKDGSKLKLTVAEYLTSGDRSIQSIGVTPDVALQYMFVPKALKKPRDQIRLLAPTRTHSERNLKLHLTSRYAKKAEPPAHKLRYLYEPPKKQNALREDDDESPQADQPLDDKFVEDFEIRLARHVLETTKHATRAGMLKEVKDLVGKRQLLEETKTVEALKKLGIDWQSAAKDAKPTQRIVASVIAKGGSKFTAGSTVHLVGTVTNKGKTPAYRVHMRIKADDRTFNERELVFGYLAPGQTRTFDAKVKISKAAVDRVDVLNFDFKEQTGAKAEVASVKLRVVAAPEPKFAYSYQLVDEGNGDGLVQAAERVRIRVTIKNTGTGPAEKTSAVLRNASGDDVLLRKARFQIGEIKPGAEKTIEFALDVAKVPKLKTLVIELGVADRVSRAGLREKLKYKVHAPGGGVNASTGLIKIIGAKQVAVREGAQKSTHTVAFATKDATFTKTGTVGDWVRVDLGGGRPGFIAKTNVADAAGKNAKPSITPHWQVTPPILTVNIPTLEANKATYTLQGRVKDETRVEDVYIYVSNWGAKIENKKVFYKSNRTNKTGPSAKQLSFAHDIPLWPGSNRVTIVARENRDVLTSQTIVIYRK